MEIFDPYFVSFGGYFEKKMKNLAFLNLGERWRHCLIKKNDRRILISYYGVARGIKLKGS